MSLNHHVIRRFIFSIIAVSFYQFELYILSYIDATEIFRHVCFAIFCVFALALSSIVRYKPSLLENRIISFALASTLSNSSGCIAELFLHFYCFGSARTAWLPRLMTNFEMAYAAAYTVKKARHGSTSETPLCFLRERSNSLLVTCIRVLSNTWISYFNYGEDKCGVLWLPYWSIVWVLPTIIVLQRPWDHLSIEVAANIEDKVGARNWRWYRYISSPSKLFGAGPKAADEGGYLKSAEKKPESECLNELHSEGIELEGKLDEQISG